MTDPNNGPTSSREETLHNLESFITKAVNEARSAINHNPSAALDLMEAAKVAEDLRATMIFNDSNVLVLRRPQAYAGDPMPFRPEGL
jgi:hypothetical protein